MCWIYHSFTFKFTNHNISKGWTEMPNTIWSVNDIDFSLFKPVCSSSLAPALSYRYEGYVERCYQLYCDYCVFISVLFAQRCYNEETAKLLELQPESLPLKYHRINVRNVTKKWKISKVSFPQWVTTVVYLEFVVWWTTKMSAVSLNVSMSHRVCVCVCETT